MAEPVKRMDEQSYPEASRIEAAVTPGCLPAADLGMTPGETTVERDRLNNTAEAIGTAVGTAVERVRQIPERLADMKQRFTLIRGRARDRATDKATDLRDTAQDTARQVRTRAQYYANHYPVQTILGIAGVAFVFGFVLRIWRSNRA
jgi:hypothetical protein